MGYKIIRPRHGIKSLWDNYKSRIYKQGEMLVVSPESGVGSGPVNVKFGDGVTDYEHLPFAIQAPTRDILENGMAPLSTGGAFELDKRKAGTTVEDLLFYVDAANGNDSNNGLSDTTAYKTIQKAVDSVPKVLAHAAIIYVAEGTYDETVEVHGFTGKNLTIRSTEASLETANKYVINGGVNIYHSNAVQLTGFTINGALGSGASVYTSANSYSSISNCICNDSTANFGILVGYGANCYISGCNISNHSVGFGAQVLGAICANNITGNNNNTGAYGRQGGVVRLQSALSSDFATTLCTSASGGVVTDVSGAKV